MDKIHYTPGWVERPSTEKSAMTQAVHRQGKWIFEGGHSTTYPERVNRADTFIWLDYPVWVRIFRVLRRSLIYRGQSRPDLPEGCPEQFNAQTLDFLWFIIRTRKSARKKLLGIFDCPPAQLETVRLSTNKSIEKYVAKVMLLKQVSLED